jgi:uncharacterized protein (TIGR03435 family)
VEAYQLRFEQVIGPAWLDSDHFDLIAKVPSGATRADLQVMIRKVLNERFELKLHHEKRSPPVYVFTIRRLGPKFKAATPDEIAALNSDSHPDVPVGKDGFPGPVPGRINTLGTNGKTRVRGVACRMTALIQALTYYGIDRPIIDNTGLDGEYDFTLEFSHRSQGRRGQEASPTDAAEPETTLLQALRNQLGLSVSATNAPLDTLIVDSGRRIPVEN